MHPRLCVRGLSKRFGATQALLDATLRVEPGEVHAVLGENGAGKSTLMRILAGEILPDAGQMLVDGVAFHPSGPGDARKAGVTMVSQELAVCPHLSVAANIMLGQEPTRFGWLSPDAMDREATRAMQLCAGNDSRAWIDLRQKVASLPTASMQLVEIARALAGTGRRSVLILDEPTSSLGMADVQRLFDVVRKLCRDGVAVLYVSHFLEEVGQIADRYTVLRDGAVAGAGVMRDATTGDLVQMMVGRRVERIFVRSPRPTGAPVLQLSDLAGDPKPVRASLTLHAGEVLGVAGLVGAGRTELVRAVFGLDPIRSGQIRFGAWFGPGSPAQRLAQGMGLLSEDRKSEGLAVEMSLAHNLVLSKTGAVEPWGFVSPARHRRTALAWMARLAIKAQSPWQRVSDLSGGNQQKVALARLLHHDVDVLLLDEPTRGVDVASKVQIYQLMDQLALRGKAILMISSYLPELLGVCDRICVMCKGELGPARPSSDWSERTLLEHATGVGA